MLTSSLRVDNPPRRLGGWRLSRRCNVWRGHRPASRRYGVDWRSGEAARHDQAHPRSGRVEIVREAHHMRQVHRGCGGSNVVLAEALSIGASKLDGDQRLYAAEQSEQRQNGVQIANLKARQAHANSHQNRRQTREAEMALSPEIIRAQRVEMGESRKPRRTVQGWLEHSAKPHDVSVAGTWRFNGIHADSCALWSKLWSARLFIPSHFPRGRAAGDQPHFRRGLGTPSH